MSEVVGSGSVALVDCDIEMGKSFAADRGNIGVVSILSGASSFLKSLIEVVIIG